MPRFTFEALMFTVIICAIITSGCSNEVPTRYSNDTILTDGHIYLDGEPVAGAQIRAISANGTYRISNVTDGNGTYALYLPNGTQYNLTASYKGLTHTVWPVAAGTYDINLTKTPRSFIMGQGVTIGGPPGSKSTNASKETIIARPANSNDTITAKVGSDGRYILEVKPGVQYQVRGDGPWPVWLNYRNFPNNSLYGGWAMNLTLGQDETILINFRVHLP
ncbi:MAG: carboxypeptidase-like regulatory domain-containing protein [Methanocella sp.]